MNRLPLFLNRIFLTPVDARRYALVRIVFSVVAFCHLVDIWPERMSLLSDEGMFLRPSVFVQWNTFSVFYVFHSPMAVNIFLILSGLAVISLGFGWHTRCAAFLVWIWQVSASNGMYPALSASDSVFRAFSFLIMLSPCGEAWSVDALLRKRKLGTDSCPLALSYGLVLMRYQLSLIYLCTFLAKIPDPAWITGDAVGFFLLSVYSRHPFQAIADFPRLVVILSYLTLVIEFLLPWLLWNRRTRVLGFVLGWGLHGTILVSSRLGMFSLVMMASYICFLDSADIESIKSFFLKIPRLFAIQKLSGENSPAMEHQPHVTARPTLEA